MLPFITSRLAFRHAHARQNSPEIVEDVAMGQNMHRRYTEGLEANRMTSQ